MIPVIIIFFSFHGTCWLSCRVWVAIQSIYWWRRVLFAVAAEINGWFCTWLFLPPSALLEHSRWTFGLTDCLVWAACGWFSAGDHHALALTTRFHLAVSGVNWLIKLFKFIHPIKKIHVFLYVSVSVKVCRIITLTPYCCWLTDLSVFVLRIYLCISIN